MNVEYRVLSGASAKSLEEQVVDLCTEGYIPQGGVAVTTYSNQTDTIFEQPNETLYSQAMIKVLR